ncbi:MAG: flippase-like domain-containing protein [Myxococcota bacterium]|nr:flippase-like domain-containing protein [Myxococcota bacterium]
MKRLLQILIMLVVTVGAFYLVLRNVEWEGSPTDVSVHGTGFFQLEDSEGERVYSRSADFVLAEDGTLRTAAGHRLVLDQPVPAGAEVTIGEDGVVLAHMQGQGSAQAMGQVALARFETPSELDDLGAGVFGATEASGVSEGGAPGSQGFGTVLPRMGVKDSLQRANYLVFFCGVALFLGLHLARSVRWGRLIQAVRPDVTFRSYFSICSVGFMLINILPFRLGEFVRPYLLYDRESVPFGSGMATVLVERVLDILALGLIFACVLLFADLPAETAGTWTVEVAGADGSPESYNLVSVGRWALLSVGLPFGGGLIVLLLLGERGVALARRMFGILGSGPARIASNFLMSFLEAVRALGSPRALWSVFSWTVTAWVVNICSMWVMARGFGIDFGFWDAAALLVSICIVLIIPPTPGFVGVFELGVVVALALYGESKDLALAFGGLVHLCQFLILASLGSVFLMVDRISIGGLMRGMREMRTGQPDAGSPGEAVEA